jgi:dTDP-4-amino-4,6-dideoxygalactose transaminase
MHKAECTKQNAQIRIHKSRTASHNCGLHCAGLVPRGFHAPMRLVIHDGKSELIHVPLLDLTLQYASIRPEVEAAIARVCASQQFINGPEVEAFEREIAAFVGVPFAIGVSSGTDALLVSLMALDIGPGDEVITPTFSFFATAGCVTRVGARPVFADVDPATLMMRAEDIEPLITPRTKAIVPVHLYGLCADMAPILALANARGIPVIEDAAQALGATYQGRSAGSFGATACFSFFPSKNLGAFGDAGLVTTSDEALAARIRRLRNHGAEKRYYHSEVGGNFRIDALQAAVLRAKLPHLTRWNAQRCANADRYRHLFTNAGLEQVTLPVEAEGRTHIYHQYVIRLPERDRVRAHLTACGIGTDIYYPVPFHRQEFIAGVSQAGHTYPVADRASAEVLALPIFPELTPAQQEYVVATITACWKRAAV